MARTKQDGISRVQRAAMLQELRAAGHGEAEIRAALGGISRSYYRALISDPDGSKEKLRKERYKGTCVDCGAVTTYGAPTRCVPCARRRQHENRKWTPERIIADIQDWNRIYGQPPRAKDWLLQPPDDGTPGFRRWPHVGIIQKEFGSWSNALEAAGFERREIGHYDRFLSGRVRAWTKERILKAIREWVSEYGDPPSSTQWSWSGSNHPCRATVIEHFGNWDNAIREAGFAPAPMKFARSGRYSLHDLVLDVQPFADREPGRSLLDVVEQLPERSHNGNGTV